MGILSIILLVLFVVVSLLLIFLVAVQDEKSQGLGGVFGGSSTSVFGTGASPFLNKATTTLAVLFVVLALLVSVVTKSDAPDTLLDTAAQTGAWYESGSAEAAAPAEAEATTVTE